MSRRKRNNKNKKNNINSTQVNDFTFVDEDEYVDNTDNKVEAGTEAVDNYGDETVKLEDMPSNEDVDAMNEEPVIGDDVSEEELIETMSNEAFKVNSGEEEYYEDVYDDDSIYYEDVEEYGSFSDRLDEADHDYDDFDIRKHDGFGGFVRELASNVKNGIRKKKTIVAAVGAFVLIAIIAIVVTLAVSSSKNNNKTKPGRNVSDNSLAEVPTDIDAGELLENEYPAVNEVITQYFQAIQNGDAELLSSIRNHADAIELARAEVKSEYVESYSDITCYTKQGPFPNSYIVYASYKLKVKSYDEVAPGISTFLVCTADDGSLYLYSDDYDQNVADYIKLVTAQDDVAQLFMSVDTSYKELLASNPEYAEYMKALKQMIKNDVATKLADAYLDPSVSDNSVSDNSISENTVPDNQPDNTPKTFEVKATTTVNVRSSDSTDADPLGKVTEGTVLTCNEEKINGWSQIVYEGQIGYIKTEYLTKVNAGDDVNTAIATGSITVNQTVNIRAKASTSSESLGVAYSGESLPLVEHLDNGWTKVIYKDKEAYVKTEYVNK